MSLQFAGESYLVTDEVEDGVIRHATVGRHAQIGMTGTYYLKQLALEAARAELGPTQPLLVDVRVLTREDRP